MYERNLSLKCRRVEYEISQIKHRYSIRFPTFGISPSLARTTPRGTGPQSPAQSNYGRLPFSYFSSCCLYMIKREISVGWRPLSQRMLSPIFHLRQLLERRRRWTEDPVWVEGKKRKPLTNSVSLDPSSWSSTNNFGLTPSTFTGSEGWMRFQKSLDEVLIHIDKSLKPSRGPCSDPFSYKRGWKWGDGTSRASCRPKTQTIGLCPYWPFL